MLPSSASVPCGVLAKRWREPCSARAARRFVNHQTITREEALIADTRSNSYFVMRENDLGSIQPGKLADLVVIDRDYLTVPADQIKDIRPVLTMVGGKIAFDAAAAAAP